MKIIITVHTTLYVVTYEHYPIGQDYKKNSYLNYTFPTML